MLGSVGTSSRVTSSERATRSRTIRVLLDRVEDNRRPFGPEAAAVGLVLEACRLKAVDCSPGALGVAPLVGCSDLVEGDRVDVGGDGRDPFVGSLRHLDGYRIELIERA